MGVRVQVRSSGQGLGWLGHVSGGRGGAGGASPLQLPNLLIQSLRPSTQGQANCSAEAPVPLATDYYFRFYRLCD